MTNDLIGKSKENNITITLRAEYREFRGSNTEKMQESNTKK